MMLPPPDAEGSAALVALLTALPFGLAAGWMLLLAKSSQHFGEGHVPPGLHCFKSHSEREACLAKEGCHAPCGDRAGICGMWANEI